MTNRTIMLSADLDRTNVVSLAHESAEMLASGIGPLTLDGSGVARVRLCAVQMLASAARSAAVAGVPFKLEQPTAELVAAIRLCGLTDLVLPADGSVVQ
jgi:anti-anti-sigma regulatory factor